MNVLIRIKPGHQMNGEGEALGRDSTGVLHTFWRHMGHMEIPVDLAISLERERPQRFEIVDREVAKKLLGGEIKPSLSKKPAVEKLAVPKPKIDKLISLKQLNDMIKDEINDWAARNDYEVTMYDTKKEMINKLVKQIEKRTGKKVS